MLIAINYHYVRPTYDAPHPGIHGITPSELGEQLNVLSALGAFVSAKELSEAVRGEGPGLPAVSFLVTFDDGLREQYEHALPVLDAREVPALFFVNTAPIANRTLSRVHKIHLLRSETEPTRFAAELSEAARGAGASLPDLPTAELATSQYRYDDVDVARLKYLLNFSLPGPFRDLLVDGMFAARFGAQEPALSEDLYMTRAQIAELGQREAIGSHGHEHVPLESIDTSGAQRLIDEASELLEAWAGYRPYAFSHPYGSAPRRVDALLERAGFSYG
ncbi:MAG: polysaccharide deacetylase family protein, partial [Deltaproteobacteria bacterium]|nr:polysaccharide deacetylase family protein [Deltaproteobacteria bacterium]